MKNIKYIAEWIFYLILLILITIAIITPVCLFVETKKVSLPIISVDTKNIASAINLIITTENTEPTEMSIPNKHLIKDFEVIYQTPELPTGLK